MGRKKKHPEHENLERWLVSYADFITLLFATFVVLYATAKSDLSKVSLARISFEKAFMGPTFLKTGKGTMTRPSKQEVDMGGFPNKSSTVSPVMKNFEKEIEEDYFELLKELLKEMMDKNKDEAKYAKEGIIDIQITDRGMVITINDKVLFDSGSAKIKKTAFPTLTKIGKLLKAKFYDHIIKVEGHTDNDSINTVLFPSNWELSSARSSAIVRYLISNFKFKKERMSAVGYADAHPLVENTTQENKQKNRRVQIVVLRNELIESELFDKALNRDRVKNLNKLKENLKKFKNNKQLFLLEERKKLQYSEISSAARKLLKDSKSKHNLKDVIIFRDTYDLESIKLFEELKTKERHYRKDKGKKHNSHKPSKH